MKRYLFISALVAFAALAFSCTKEELGPDVLSSGDTGRESGRVTGEVPVDHSVAPGTVIVRFSEETMQAIEPDLLEGKVVTRSMELNQAVDEYDIVSMERVFGDGGIYEERARREGLHQWYRIKYRGDAPVAGAVLAFASMKGVVSAEPERRIRVDAFNDKYFSQQTDLVSGGSKFDINVQPVWDHYTTGDPSVIVSVVDEGVDLDHADLASNCIPGGKGGSRNFAENNYKVDAMSHGTHVAGTIAAVSNNGIGVAGIAGGDYKKGKPGVRIMSCQFFGKNGYNGSAAEAIRYSADNGAIISQNSWGYNYDWDNDGRLNKEEMEAALAATIDGAMKAAVDYFIKYAGCDAEGNQKPDSPMKGGIVIFAAGNENIANGAPANYEKILAVGSVELSGYKADYSNYGDWVDICAPGSGILSTLPGDSYGNQSGTSMACPHVSGVAALVVSYCGGPGFTPDMLWDKLVGGANPRIYAKNIGPMVDALGAVTYGEGSTPEKIESYTAAPQSNNIDFTWKVSDGGDGQPAYGATLFASKDRAALENLNPAKPGEGVFSADVETSGLKTGDEAKGRISGLDFETLYYVTIAPHSYLLSYGEASEIKQVTTQTNNPPVISCDYSGDLSFGAFQTVVIPINVSDPDGHAVTVEYTPGSAADVWGTDLYGSYVVNLNCLVADPGTYTARIKATDSYGKSVSYDLTYTIRENQVPVIVKEMEDKLLTVTGESFKLEMGEFFTDADGEPLTYDVKLSNPSVLHTNRTGNTLVCTALQYGLTEVTISAVDARKASALMTFLVLVRDASVETVEYPNPVKTTLYISTGISEENIPIAVYSQTGARMYEGSQPASAFKPAQVDFSTFAPGSYSLVYTYGSKEYRKTIIKK